MGFWKKVIGGAVIGVGAVAAAPFTGGGSIVGAATLASSLAGAGAVAAGAGAAGAAAGAAMDKWDKEEEDRKIDHAYRSGEQAANARNALEADELREELARELEITVARRENILLTTIAIGICAANSDGHISEEERLELDDVVLGCHSHEILTDESVELIKSWYVSPPNLPTVWEMAKKHNLTSEKYLTIFDGVIDAVIDADNDKNAREKSFVNEWNKLSAA